MSFSRTLLSKALFVFILVSLSSCVKEVDLDQAEDISLRPKLLVNLLFFELDDEDLKDYGPDGQKIIIRDTVRLEFLDDDYIQKDLLEVEFDFKHKNTFSQDFTNTISFLSENNQEQFRMKFNVGAGTETENTELIKAEHINAIKESIKMVMEIEVLPDDQPFLGELRFESKGLFSFEF